MSCSRPAISASSQSASSSPRRAATVPANPETTRACTPASGSRSASAAARARAVSLRPAPGSICERASRPPACAASATSGGSIGGSSGVSPRPISRIPTTPVGTTSGHTSAPRSPWSRARPRMPRARGARCASRVGSERCRNGSPRESGPGSKTSSRGASSAEPRSSVARPTARGEAGAVGLGEQDGRERGGGDAAGAVRDLLERALDAVRHRAADHRRGQQLLALERPLALLAPRDGDERQREGVGGEREQVEVVAGRLRAVRADHAERSEAARADLDRALPRRSRRLRRAGSAAPGHPARRCAGRRAGRGSAADRRPRGPRRRARRRRAARACARHPDRARRAARRWRRLPEAGVRARRAPAAAASGPRSHRPRRLAGRPVPRSALVRVPHPRIGVPHRYR